MKVRRLKFRAQIANLCDWNPTLLVAALTALLFCPLAANAQLGSLLASKPAPASTPLQPVDPWNRTTPRRSMMSFLEACHAQRFRDAANYLDLSKIAASERAVDGPELAKQLADILDRDPGFELEQLSDDPAGKMDDGLAPSLELLLKLNGPGPAASLFLEKTKRHGVEVWIVSSESVTRVDDLDTVEASSPIERRMPSFLVRHKLLGTSWWAWIALVVLVLLLFVFSHLLSRLFLWMLTPVLNRFSSPTSSRRLATLTNPLRLLISLAVFRLLMQMVTPSALLRDYLIKLLVVLFALGAAALIVRIIELASTGLIGRLPPGERAISNSLVPLAVRVVRIVIFLIAGIFVLSAWGYNTNALIAGLGVGGLAVALAAQKTIENLFGAVSLISDRPVLVGDFCQFGTQSGTVEDIGLRSTRVRTNDRTVVTIPNSVFSTMTIENLSRRDKMWFHPTLRLRRDTSLDKVKEMMDVIAEILRAHEMTQVGDVPVRLVRIGDYSIDLDIFSYVATPDYNQFLKVQTELLTRFIEEAQKRGVEWAIPLAESLNLNLPVPDPKANSNSRPA